MKKYIIVSFALLLLFSLGLKVKADTTGTLESRRAKVLSAEIANIDANFKVDKTPRIIIFGDLPAQHINTSTGKWVADIENVPLPMGAGRTSNYKYPSEIDYCKKWYPKTVATEPYRMESVRQTGSPKNNNEEEYFTPAPATECLESSPEITIESQVQGEQLIKGKMEMIGWTDYTDLSELQVIKKYDVNLIHYYPPCSGNKCSRPSIDKFVIVSKVLNPSWGYSWEVGRAKKSEVGSSIEVPDGKYFLQVCKSDTDICEISNNYFEIVSVPIISSITGTSLLSLNQKSVWTINAHNLDREAITYSVDWGDTVCKLKKTCSAKIETSKSPTFQHSFSNEGFFKTTFIATASSGKSTKETIGMRVSSPISSISLTTLSLIPVTLLSPNNSDIVVNGQNQKIEWKDSIKDTSIKQYYDIFLYYYCLDDPDYCNGAISSPGITFPIAKNVAGYSYDWQVGKIKSLETNQDTNISDISYVSKNVLPLDESQVVVPDGTSKIGIKRITISGRKYHSYFINVCRAGTDVCDSMDNPLLIVTDCGFRDEQKCGEMLAFGDLSSTVDLNFDWKTRIGTTGDDVKMIQSVLKNEELFFGNITGYYDSLTQAAVDKYYTKYNITQNFWKN